MKTEKHIILLAVMLVIALQLNAQEPNEIKRPRITGISHVALYVKNIENMRQFYKDFLGYAEPFSLSNKEDNSLILTFMKINDRQSIEIFPEKKPEADRFYHFALETDDAEGMRIYLASKGFKVPKKLQIGRTGNYNYNVTDPNGAICEIIQYVKGGSTMTNFGKDNPSTRISTRMSHFGFMVPDLDLAMKFYRDILGFKETWRGSADGKNVSWVTLKVPDGNDYIELMLYDKAPTTAEKGSMNHLCLEVDDVPAALNILKSRTLPEGCRISADIKIGKNMKRQINCFDGDGTRIEIMEANTVDEKPVPSSTLPPLKFLK